MKSLLLVPRPVLLGLAILFAAATTLYSAVWMYYIRQEPYVRLGIEYEYSSGSMLITKVFENSAAAHAELRPGDRILAVNGRPLDSVNPFLDVMRNSPPGTLIHLTVSRPGAETIERRAMLGPPPQSDLPWAQRVAGQIIGSFPVLFFVVGFAVLFLRLQERNAWLLALLFASLIAGAPIFQVEPLIHPSLRGFALAFKIIFYGLGGAVFYYFFATFPVSSPIDRRLPWLKVALLAGAVAVTVPLGLWVLSAGQSRPLLELAHHVGETSLRWGLSVYFFGSMGLGLVSLLWNGLRAPTADARRKISVIVWGTVVGIVPFMLLMAAALYARKDPYEFPFWVWAPCVLAVFFLPLSIAYAVVKHRVMEIPVLLKRSARYLLVQRGAIIFGALAGTSLTLFSARIFSRLLPTQPEASVVVGIAFGALLLSVSVAGGRRVKERIDRAFFRSAYDARKILEHLATKTRTAMSHPELAALIRSQLHEALHPVTLAVYLEAADGSLEAEHGTVPAKLQTIPTALPLLAELARRGQPWEVPPPEAGAAEGLAALEPLRPDCLVPLLGRDGRLVGLLALGPRLSEEPYSGEDKRLLASIASQAGIASENIRLAERIAERLEAERRAVQEMEIARQVQRKLFPQRVLPLATLEYGATCIQARAVGGDYYDFLDLGLGRIGLVLADISGKGMSGALLMANLQASLRSRSALALQDPSNLLTSVNDVLLESTEPEHFATLFFATYDDTTRSFRYANCGHNPPLLIRLPGTVERLTATATVLGMFADWACEVEEVRLAPGDTLVLFTDGISEATSADGQEFGEARLLEAFRAHRHQPVSMLLETLLRIVQEFSSGEQADDLTLVIVRAR